MTKNKESNPKKEYNPINRATRIRAEIQQRTENAQRAQQVLQQETAMITKLQGSLEEAIFASSVLKEKKEKQPEKVVRK